MKLQLGQLEQVDIRKIWKSEPLNFTPWLAENLDILGNTLDMDIELLSTEEWVGRYRADIVCKNTLDDTVILIENQLGTTDHNHLGQLITYASGTESAYTVIWIATHITDEHRAALDWLNTITDSKYNFFGLEVELWKIGDSAVAPKFNIISKPNDWSRSVRQGGITPTKAAQLKFWLQLKELVDDKSPVKLQKALPQHWIIARIGRSGFHMSCLQNTRDKRIGVELYINHEFAKDFFNQLYADKTKIEADLGLSVEWMELPDKGASRIVCYWNNVDLQNEERWNEYQLWMKKTLEKFYSVFRSRVQRLVIPFPHNL